MAKTTTTSKGFKPSNVQALPATLAIQPGMVPTKIVKEYLGNGITRITTYADKD